MQKQSFVTCDLLDAHPKQDIQVAMPIFNGLAFKSYGARQSYFGKIVTVNCFEDNSKVKELLATDGTGKVLVVDGAASMRCALMGDMIAKSAHENHWNGVIIYGCVRDVDVLKCIDIGVHALAAIPQKSNRKGRGQIDVALAFAGIRFEPNHYIYIDNNGILVSAQQLLD